MTATDPGRDDMATARSPKPRGRRRPRWIFFTVIVAEIVAVDQLTKAWIQAHVEPGSAIRLVDDELRLVLSPNTGALFGLFRDQAGLFAIFSVGVVALIIAYEARAGRSLYLTVTLGLLLGGALGNLADRVRLGHVIDFVDAGVGDIRFYTFNVADAAISLAIVLLLALAVWPSLAGTADRSTSSPEPSPTPSELPPSELPPSEPTPSGSSRSGPTEADDAVPGG